MRAAVLTALNEPLSILEVDVPPPAFGQVLVRIEAAGKRIGKDLGFIQRMHIDKSANLTQMMLRAR